MGNGIINLGQGQGVRRRNRSSPSPYSGLAAARARVTYGLMSAPSTLPGGKSALDRYFYAAATVLLLVLTIVGFKLFYFEGRAYPDREITPPIRTLVITHGVAMSVWMLLALAQPLLVAAGRVQLHRKLGAVTAIVAAALTLLGLKIGIESTRVAPPDMMFGPFTPKQFMAVPVLDILLFAGFVAAGIVFRRRPDIHRPAMFLATLAAVGAALSRIDAFNTLYYGTIFQKIFGDFFFSVVLGAVIVLAKWLSSKSWDRWLGLGYALMTLVYLGIVQFMGTATWGRIADFLLGL